MGNRVKNNKLILVVFCSILLSMFLDKTVLASDVNLLVDIQPALSVEITNVSMDASINGQITEAASSISVYSNCSTGFTTTITSSKESAVENATSLVNSKSSDIIPTLTEQTTQSSFPVNYWGISFDGDNYYGIPARNETPLIMDTLSTTSVGAKTAPLTIGVKINENTAEGDYSNSILVTVVPNHIPISITESFKLAGKETVEISSGDFYAMQDMTPEICNKTEVLEKAVQLVDIRDNKLYWITKLADGNCWMTQNLDYDLSVETNQTLNPATSNVIEQKTVVPDEWGEEQDKIYYIDGGNKYFPNGTGVETSIDCTIAGDENCHYHLGDYYSWKAATTGYVATEIEGQDAPESICPAGWRLPTARDYTDTYSFGRLTNIYGITENANGTSDEALVAAPLYFNHTGYMRNAGSHGKRGYGYYNSASAGVSGNILVMDFISTRVRPSVKYGGIYGYSVRCVANGSQIEISFDVNGGYGTFLS